MKMGADSALYWIWLIIL